MLAVGIVSLLVLGLISYCVGYFIRQAWVTPSRGERLACIGGAIIFGLVVLVGMALLVVTSDVFWP